MNLHLPFFDEFSLNKITSHHSLYRFLFLRGVRFMICKTDKPPSATEPGSPPLFLGNVTKLHATVHPSRWEEISERICLCSSFSPSLSVYFGSVSICPTCKPSLNLSDALFLFLSYSLPLSLSLSQFLLLLLSPFIPLNSILSLSLSLLLSFSLYLSLSLFISLSPSSSLCISRPDTWQFSNKEEMDPDNSCYVRCSATDHYKGTSLEASFIILSSFLSIFIMCPWPPPNYFFFLSSWLIVLEKIDFLPFR